MRSLRTTPRRFPRQYTVCLQPHVYTDAPPLPAAGAETRENLELVPRRVLACMPQATVAIVAVAAESAQQRLVSPKALGD